VPGTIATAEGRAALWLTPRSWLIHCAPEEEVALADRVNRASPDMLVHAVPFGGALCWLELSGRRSGPGTGTSTAADAALELLTEGGFVSLERGGLPVGRSKRTLIAQIGVVVIHQNESVWLIGVERSRARYFAQWLTAAAAG
jgi:heterotetrameric sarcosine oxidase gamma subunit